MVAPSLVTVIFDLSLAFIDYKILSIPLGPKVVLTKSATAIAPTNDYYHVLHARTYHSSELSSVFGGIVFEKSWHNILICHLCIHLRQQHPFIQS